MKFNIDSKNILGFNERNLSYIRKYNSATSKRIADDKLLTKKVLAENNIETPKLIGTIKNFSQLEKFKFHKLPESMVVKPKHGFGGEGIIVFFSKDKDDNWVKADKTRYSQNDLKKHISGILEGNFSLKNTPDTAFFEERVVGHPIFKKYSYRGLPDVRVIVFNSVPVMAMVRLPTKESDGKANLHMGGVGVGIDIANGTTTYAVQHDKFVNIHPDTNAPLRGIKIPFWEKILELAVRSQIAAGLGFAGIDLVIDKVKGPLILELNARPGLALQICNNDGLKGRLERVKGLKIKNVEHGIKVGQNLFGGEVEEEIEEVSGKKLIGYAEHAKIFGKNGKSEIIECRIDTGAYSCAMSVALAERLGYGDVIEEFNEFKKTHPFTDYKSAQKVRILALKEFEDNEEMVDVTIIRQSSGISLRPTIELEMEMAGIKIKNNFTISMREKLTFEVLIGRSSMEHFLVDPTGKFLYDEESEEYIKN